MNDTRIVLCQACGSEGRVYVTGYDHGSWNEPPHWYERDTGPCPYCEGTGGEIIETEPIEMEDLEIYSPPIGEPTNCVDCGAMIPLRFPCTESTCPQPNHY